MNPLFNAMGGNAQMGGFMTRANNFMNQLNQFKQVFNGDPQQKVQEWLKTGKYTQEQFNQAAQMANRAMQMLGLH